MKSGGFKMIPSFDKSAGTPDLIFARPDLQLIVRPYKWLLGSLYFMNFENGGQTVVSPVWPVPASLKCRCTWNSRKNPTAGMCAVKKQKEYLVSLQLECTVGWAKQDLWGLGKLSLYQNDSSIGRSFWQKNSQLQYTMTLLQGPKDPVLSTLVYSAVYTTKKLVTTHIDILKL